MLTVALAFNYIDRFALGLVLDDIGRDLRLTDAQLGLLSGIAFALFYAVLGVPIARWADRGNRVNIISLSIVVWSFAVTLCGAARTFMQLMLIRVVVGVGESGCVPPSLSLIASYFAREQRARAVSIYMQGISASLLLGYFAAGWINQLWGWRTMFAAIGLPGLVVGIILHLTIREVPNRSVVRTTNQAEVRPFWEVCFYLLRSGTFRHMLYCCAVNWFFSYGIIQWVPAFFSRSFGLSSGALGTWLAVIYGVSFTLGNYFGGEWATRRARRQERRQLQVMAIVTAASGVVTAFVFIPLLAPTAALAFAWLGLCMFGGQSVSGPQFAVIQTVVPERMQAVATSLIYLVGNLVGMGLGPWATGALSDLLRPWAGDDSLRYALLLMTPACIWSAWHFWAATKSVDKDIQLAESYTAT